MTPSKSHGGLHDVATYCIKLAYTVASLSNFYLSALANSIAVVGH